MYVGGCLRANRTQPLVQRGWMVVSCGILPNVGVQEFTCRTRISDRMAAGVGAGVKHHGYTLGVKWVTESSAAK